MYGFFVWLVLRHHEAAQENWRVRRDSYLPNGYGVHSIYFPDSLPI